MSKIFLKTEKKLKLKLKIKEHSVHTYFTVIVLEEISSELESWKNVSNATRDSEERRKANAFIRALEPIIHELKTLELVHLDELEDSANTILGCIDDLWKLDDYHYPQERMESLLNMSSNCLSYK